MTAPSRCFVAVEPPPALTERLRTLERPARPGLRWTAEGQWHVTLKFFPAVDPDALLAALDSWAATPPGLPAAEAVAGPAPQAMSRRVWTVPVAGLDDLAAGVAAATAHLPQASAGDDEASGGSGADPEDDEGAEGEGVTGTRGGPPRPTRSLRPFRGHLTLARARYPSALRHLPRPDVAVRWQVPEIAAVRSELHAGGAHHEVLRRWPLPPA